MRRAAIGVAAALVGGLVIGWAWPGRPPETVPAVSGGPRQADVPELGAGTREAVRFLEDFMQANAPPPPPPAEVAPAPPAPPPPDIAVVFRGQLVALVRDQTTGKLEVLASEPGSGGRQTRRIRVGEVFSDGWRLVGLTPTSATLRKGRLTRAVPFYGPVGERVE